MIIFKAATLINRKFPLPDPASSKKNLPKKPAVGGTPARENSAIVSIHESRSVHLYGWGVGSWFYQLCI